MHFLSIIRGGPFPIFALRHKNSRIIASCRVEDLLTFACLDSKLNETPGLLVLHKTEKNMVKAGPEGGVVKLVLIEI